MPYLSNLLTELTNTIRNYLIESNNTDKIYINEFSINISAAYMDSPKWVINVVAPKNSRNDYVINLNKYMLAGVSEYWIINPHNESVFVYYLKDKDFSPKRFTFNENIEVNIFKNFFINLKQFSKQ